MKVVSGLNPKSLCLSPSPVFSLVPVSSDCVANTRNSAHNMGPVVARRTTNDLSEGRLLEYGFPIWHSLA